MDYIQKIKNDIERFYNTNTSIHICVSTSRPRMFLKASPVKIVGVYKNIFRIEECEDKKTLTQHTFQYAEVLIGQVKIEEIDYVPIVTNPKTN